MNQSKYQCNHQSKVGTMKGITVPVCCNNALNARHDRMLEYIKDEACHHESAKDCYPEGIILPECSATELLREIGEL